MTSNNTNIKFLVGKNFSGRTDHLKRSCRVNTGKGKSGIYVGEIPYNYLSGVSPTVKEELDLFSHKTEKETHEALTRLLDKFGFDKLYENNPFTLSGGEQVVLSIAIGLLLNPALMAIDTAAEQLNKEWSEPLFNFMKHNMPETQFLISDNRMDEYIVQYDVLAPEGISQNHKYIFQKPVFVSTKEKCMPHEIHLKDVVFGYLKKIKVLQSITMELRSGNIYFLNGPNGAGKSTLAKVLSGILRPQSGSIIVNNERVNPYKYPGKLFGYSFQNPDEQLFSRTVEEEILRFDKKESQEIYNRRELFLEMFGLKRVRSCHPAELPYVVRKRIAIAATLATDRPWYILDEPTIGQDSEFLDFLVMLFNQMAEQGKGLIVISHSQTFIQKFKAKMLYLDKGRLISN